MREQTFIGFLVEPEMAKAARVQAAIENRSKSDLIREALREALERRGCWPPDGDGDQAQEAEQYGRP
jgi:hypothetical protein